MYIGFCWLLLFAGNQEQVYADNLTQIINVSAIVQKNDVLITWAVLPTPVSGYFEIEKAGIDRNFKTIGILFPEEIKGNTGFKFLETVKKREQHKIYYYRIKLINPDSSIIYSETILIKRTGNTLVDALTY